MALTVRRTVAVVASAVLSLGVPAALTATAAFAGTDAGFEIDGNTVASSGIDWDSQNVVGVQPVENDNAPTDTTVYKGDANTKENTDPSGWEVGGSPPNKDDLTKIYAYTTVGDAGHTWVFFGFDRESPSGTSYEYLELNQHAAAGAPTYHPIRTQGDLRFKLHETGNETLALESTSTWTGTAWNVASYDSNPAGFDYAISGDDKFVEFALDLKVLLGLDADCPPLFSSIQFRTATGESDKNIKDFIVPLSITGGSTCSALTIEKRAAGTDGALLGGAEFRITPNPIPGVTGDAAQHLDVTDNDANDADSADGVIVVDPTMPGDYTVTEIAAPAGYLIDNTDPVDVTAPESAAADRVVFTDTKVVASLGLKKTAAESYFAGAGDVIHYTYTLTNTGNVALSAPYAVDDDTIAQVDCSKGPATLEPGSSFACTATYAVSAGNVTDKHVDNTATATAMFGETVVTSEPASESVPLASLEIVKSVDKAAAGYGDTLTYTLKVTNTGMFDLTGITVADVVPKGTTYVSGGDGFEKSTGTVSWDPFDLAAGATKDGLTFAVTIDTPDFDPAVGLPAETIDNVAVAASDQLPDATSNHVLTPVTAVLGEKVVRPPNTLPFTGSALPIPGAVLVGLLLIGTGTALAFARRRSD